MAYAPLPKLVPMGSPRVAAEEVSKVMYPDLLHSEPVQRLLNQPHIVIKPINIPEISSPKSPHKKRKSSNERRPRPDITMSLVDTTPEDFLQPLKPPKCPLEPLEPLERTLGAQEDADDPLKPFYLPSKFDGDSGISLHPIINHRRKCGHWEPCETIICDVNVQQYIDSTGSSPMIATNITDSEITAPVTKHCENALCDALNIDHNRCRRLKLKLNRCDKFNVCDICGAILKNRKTRVHHRKCKRRDEYRHNEVNGAQLLKERMREREIQIMEAIRTKRKDYVKAENDNDRAAECLKNNSELILIPKAPVQGNQPFISVKNLSSMSALTPTVQNLPAVLQPQPQHPRIFVNSAKLIAPKSDKNLVQPANNSISSISNLETGNSQSQDQLIGDSAQPRAIAYPLNVNNWTAQGAPVTSKPMVMPITVVPIANLKSEPSMLHRKEGIPRFCIIANNTIQMQSFVTVPNAQTVSNPGKSVFIKPNPVMPIRPAPAGITRLPRPGDKFNKIVARRRMKYKRRKKGEKKPFECSYCSKRFLTDWYFKVHVAKHRGEKRVRCEICETVYKNDSELKKHVSSEHRSKVEVKVEEEEIDEDPEFEGGEEQGDGISEGEGEQEGELAVEGGEGEQRGEVVCENCQTCFETILDMENHSCLDVNGVFTEVEIKYEEVVEEEDIPEDPEDDGIEGYEGLEELEEIEQFEEVNGETDPLGIDEINDRVNGDFEDSESNEHHWLTVKSWHSGGDEDEVSQVFITERKRKRKSIYR
ncbi:uncharacterized protein [Fopius arisanus]|uniref:ZBTB44 protein n=1 Tax=Fopius arisanus TaxID=64838 RepID=A0A0C9RR01_9HYME|nr:PREDICTED: uncharacterized protein LOC105262762 [Fopius arisanus]